MSKQSADWIILVYISADRALTNFAIESLKQLKRSTGVSIVALAQMEATGNTEAQRYVFDGSDDANASIENNLQPSISPAPSPGGIANPRNLTEFLKWASQYEAKHRCLFLWGHGYELLLNEDLTILPTVSENHGLPGNGLKETWNGDMTDGGTNAGAATRKYLAPKNLKKALEDAKPSIGRLDIIGVDACSMSLVELAGELSDCADFLIASQEDVPDASFPYDQILLKLQHYDRNDVAGISTAIPQLYAQAYQDYVIAPGTGMKEITLTSLRLEKISTVMAPLSRLAKALLSSSSDPVIRKTILAARKAARDFALGLFVDLRDFCLQVSMNLDECELRSACEAVRHAVDARGQTGCIIADQNGDGTASRCHGLSIYFPYLKKAELDQLRESVLSAGSTVDQVPLLVKGGTNHILKGRSVQVAQIEDDFESLTEFKKTEWCTFIKHGWSVILASEESTELDEHYCGQQCAINLLSLLRTSEQPSQRTAAMAAKY